MQNYLDLNQTLVDSGKPYIDLEITDEYIIREFGQNIDPIEMMWHRDDEDREVEVLQAGNGWQFQYDEKLPLTLIPNTTISIIKHEWHRLWKGEGKLLLKIRKF
jgi:inorganic pyrophosphatase